MKVGDVMAALEARNAPVKAAFDNWCVVKGELAQAKRRISTARTRYDQALGNPGDLNAIHEARKAYREAQSHFTDLLALSGEAKRAWEAAKAADTEKSNALLDSLGIKRD